MVRRGQVVAGQARCPKTGETSAHSELDEVVVLRYLFTMGLRFPLDPMFVQTLRLHKMFLNKLMLYSIARLNLYFWLEKTYCFQASAENFTFVHLVHYQPKIIAVMTADGTEGEAEAQYGCYNFTYREIVSSPVTTYKNKWPVDWTSFWLYHKVSQDKNYGRTNLNYTGSSMQVLSQGLLSYFKWCNPLVCRVTSR
jgi:hypothetical protein